jgi:GTP cyclohydrolase II
MDDERVLDMGDSLAVVGRSRTAFRSSYGSATLHAFEFADGAEHCAVVVGSPEAQPHPIVRLQSACLTGTAFHAVLCDCRQQLEAALTLIHRCGNGIVLYLDQEGRAHGLVEKVRQLSLIATGQANTATAAGDHRQPDVRSYEQAAAVLDMLLPGRSVRLLTNNPLKMQALLRLGYEVEREPIETSPTPDNAAYLRAKRDFMGHLLTAV